MLNEKQTNLLLKEANQVLLLLEYDRGFAQRVLNWAKQGNINLGDKDGKVDGQTINRAAQYMALVPRYQSLFGNKTPEEIATTQDGLRVMDYVIEDSPEPIPVPAENQDEWEQILKAAYGGIPGTMGALWSKVKNSIANSLDMDDSSGSSVDRTAAMFNVMNSDPAVQQAVAKDPKAEKAAQAVAKVAKDPRKVDNLPKAEKDDARNLADLDPEIIKALNKAGTEAVSRELNRMQGFLSAGAKGKPIKWEEVTRSQLRAVYIERVFNTMLQIATRGNVGSACNKANAEKEKGKLAGTRAKNLSADYVKGKQAEKEQAAAANRKDRAMIEKVVRESLKRLKGKK
tara:strand:- start:317 stop:1345 length:1029 start_codon:yes stop_codon:yes gene_type:complete